MYYHGSRRDAGRAAVRAGQLQGLDRRDARPRSVLGGDDVHPVRLGVLAPARHDQDVLAGRRRADDVQGVHADHAAHNKGARDRDAVGGVPVARRPADPLPDALRQDGGDAAADHVPAPLRTGEEEVNVTRAPRPT